MAKMLSKSGNYCFLTGFRNCLPRRKFHARYCKSGQEPMAGELTGPRGDLLRGHSANVLCVLLYAHRIMWLSVLLREDSLCGVSGCQSQELTTGERTVNTSK